jgi:hypothetical protein
LPDDPSIDLLANHDRLRLADVWLARAAMERRVADAFIVIHEALERRRAQADLVALAERAIDDEYRHAELSRIVASRFAGRDLPAPPRLRLEVPAHKGASPELRDTLHVVGQCVLNETTASAYLETTLACAKGALARAALRELLGDEIEHGRMGWTYLASVDDETRARVAPWMLPMAYLNLRVWQEQTPEDPNQSDALTDHGSPPAGVIHEALVDALRSLIVPGLHTLRIPCGPLERWLEAGAPTREPPVEFARLDA